MSGMACIDPGPNDNENRADADPANHLASAGTATAMDHPRSGVPSRTRRAPPSISPPTGREDWTRGGQDRRPPMSIERAVVIVILVALALIVIERLI